MATTASLSLSSFRQGSTVRRRLTIVNLDGSPKDLTAATARWALYLGDAVVVGPYEIGSGIVVDGSPNDGKLIVSMLDAVTEPLLGSYRQEWRIVDGATDVQKYIGTMLALQAELEAAA